MPIPARKFKALSTGNGFSVALRNMDVSTKSNVNPLTLDQAMKVYWLLSHIKCVALAKMTIPDLINPDTRAGTNLTTSIGNVPLNISHDNLPQLNNPNIKKPFERVAHPPWLITRSKYREDKFNTSDPSQSPINAFIQVHTNAEIIRFYNGSTSDEANFIGYGLEGGGDSSSGYSKAGFNIEANTGGFGGSMAKIEIGNFMDPYTTPIDGAEITDGTVKFNIFGESISFGYRMRAREGNGPGDIKTETVDDSGANNGVLLAEARLANDSGAEIKVSVKLNGFDHFTIEE